MTTLLSIEEMDVLDSGDDSDNEPISTEMLEDISDRSQSCSKSNMREICHKIRDRIKQIQSECKVWFTATQKMAKVTHKVFKTIVKEILQDLQPLGESGSEVSHFIPEPNFFLKLQNC